VERNSMPRKPPDAMPAASAAASARMPSTSSTSSKVKPRARRIIVAGAAGSFVGDVGVDRTATRLPVRAQAQQAERTRITGDRVPDRLVPRIVQLGGLGVRPQPAWRTRIVDQVLERRGEHARV